MHTGLSRFAGLIVICCLPFLSTAQRRSNLDTTKSAERSAPTSQRPSSGPRPYAEIITAKAKTENGFFKVHKIEEKYYFEIADSLLGRDILVVNRIGKAAAENRVQSQGYAGDQIGENVLRFEKGPGHKIFLKKISFREVSSDTTDNGMYRSVINSNLQPIVSAFEIKAIAKDSATGNKSCVIDVTDFINGDNDILFFEGNFKKRLSLAQQYTDRSYIDNIRSFATNIEIRTVKTYNRSAGQAMPNMMSAAPSGPVTYELNSSMVLLPQHPMKTRNFDPRVGYFATGYTDFDADPQGVKKVSMITRWRLEPRDEDKSKYLAGQLVEPKKQIVFYIDPVTPKKWIPYLQQGVNDWNIAFEKAGWKNAIVAKEAPRNDNKSWSIDDARHSAIVYKPSDIPNASGPHVHDPRSGEILETHINWYHNVMSLLRNWYFVQTAAVDPKARTMKFEDELMGQLVRFVSSHEVGHTLGLRHNFGSSSTVPVEKLRDKHWVETNGHTPSIMDYARFNYVAQPEDSISQLGLFPRIGDYDKWAIEWGYRWFPEFESLDEEKAYLNKWIIEQTSKNPRLLFGTEGSASDPRYQSEDLGDNAMLAGAYGIKNLKRIVPNLLSWTGEPNEDFHQAKVMYGEVLSQYNRYLGHVVKNIGGMFVTPRTFEEKKDVIRFVPEPVQKEAMRFLHQQLFITPSWLLDKNLFVKAGAGDMQGIATAQAFVLSRLISNNTISALLLSEAFDKGASYRAQEMFSELKTACWTELAEGRSIDIYRRNLQKIYAEKLLGLLKPQQAPSLQGRAESTQGLNKTNDALSIVKGHARTLQYEIRMALNMVKDNDTKLHLRDLQERFKEVLDAK